MADVDDAMRLHPRRVLVLDAQKGLLEVDLKAGPDVQDGAAVAAREASAAGKLASSVTNLLEWESESQPEPAS